MRIALIQELGKYYLITATDGRDFDMSLPVLTIYPDFHATWTSKNLLDGLIPLSQPTHMAPWEVLNYQLTKEGKKNLFFYLLKFLLGYEVVFDTADTLLNQVESC